MKIKIRLTLMVAILFILDPLFGSGLNYKVVDVYFNGNRDREIRKILCETSCTTMFVLPKSEVIADIIEPTGEWIINCDNKRFVYVVPAKRGIHSSLDIITKNSKIYSFILEEISGQITSSGVVKKVMIGERFFSSNNVENRMDFSKRDKIKRTVRNENSNYKIRDKFFKVTKVVDDGITTKIYFGLSRVRPAVFVRKKGKSGYEPVRYHDNGKFYIVHRIINRKEVIVLKVGRYEAKIRRR